MDVEQMKAFTDRCSQCAAVSWGLTDEGKYYCTSCHNVTDRSEEVVSTAVIPNTKINSISRGLRQRSKHEKGWDWYVCEGFQCILYHQAEALETLGVSPELKNEVLHSFWKRYLQKSKQAYCKNPVRTSGRKAKFCKSYCKHVTTYEESNFSLSYQFILNIFSFLLRIKTSALHEEVSLLEKKLFEKKYNESKRSSRSKKVRRH
ncbi:rCG61358, isoform CRA_a [Rattus norvegicus]|uniref:TATA box-binding protein-associated factor RNA polymerase I subunit B n=1 Tax=Rattus norvegicus TaxID=10116 RepID=A6HAX0_RAT|nr:rCG61358, isoform CRA_a [Rattus norvegicus]